MSRTERTFARVNQGSSEQNNTPGKTQNSLPRQINENLLYKKTVGNCPEAIICIAGIPTSCVIDSGSQVTTVLESYFNSKLKHHIETLQSSSWVKLRAANGEEIPCIGLITAPIIIQGTTLKDVHMLIVRDRPQSSAKTSPPPVLLGCNVLKEIFTLHSKESQDSFLQQLSADPTTAAFPDQIAACHTTIARCQRISVELQHKGTDVLGLVRTGSQPIIIPAEEGVVIYGTCRQDLPAGQPILVEPTIRHREGLIVQPTVATASHGYIPIQVRNYSSQDIQLTKSTVIAKISAGQELSPELHSDFNQEHQEVVIALQKDETDTAAKLPFDVQLDDTELTQDQKDQVIQLLVRYQDVFSLNDDDIGHCDLLEHRIHLTDDIPIKQPDRRVTPQLVPEIKRQLQAWLRDGVIQQSTSPYASQMVIIRKKDGKIRLCVDYRALNQKTVRDAFPLPRITETLESLKGARYFICLDLTQGYLQIGVHKDDREKTAFRALGGLYEFRRLPFGLCNSPATFSRVMSYCFGDWFQQGIVIYLDDIMIHGATFEQALQCLEDVLEVLHAQGLKLKPGKCHFFKKQVNYLGHQVSAEGMKQRRALRRQ